MKKNRCFKLTALLLAMIMMISVFPSFALGSINSKGTGTFDTIDFRELDSTFVISHDIQDVSNKEVKDLSVADPNGSFTLKLEVSEPVGATNVEELLPENTDEVILYYSLENMTAKDGWNDDVSWKYDADEGIVIFKWRNGYKKSFKADIEICPNYPAENDISGSYALVTKSNVLVGSSTFNKDKRDRISSSKISEKNGMIFPETGERSVWTLKHVSGNYYTVYNENSAKYLEIVLPNHATLKSTTEENAQKVLVQKTNNGYYTFQYQGNNLNNQGNNAANGFASYTAGTADNEIFRLINPSDVVYSDLLMFSVNGGTGDTDPKAIAADAGTTITLPNINSTKDGQEFLGWAEASNIYVKVSNTITHTYRDVYLPGTSYTMKSGKNTLYAVYNTVDRSVQFGIRRDGVIVDEPNDNKVSDYIGHFTVNGILKEGYWVIDIDATKPVNGYYVENNVTAALKFMPTAEQIAAALKKEGNVDFDPETQYIHYYVLKYAGKWKIDGVIRNKEKVSVTYNANVPGGEKTFVKDLPGGEQVVVGSEILIGTNAGSTKVLRPIREGYLFNGWNTQPDGSGTAYSEGHYVKLTENLNLYAQWIDIREGQMVIIIHSDWPDGKLGYVGAKITLTAELSGFEGREYTLQWQYSEGNSENWIDIPGANTDTYIFTLDEINTNYNWRCVAKNVR